MWVFKVNTIFVVVETLYVYLTLHFFFLVIIFLNSFGLFCSFLSRLTFVNSSYRYNESHRYRCVCTYPKPLKKRQNKNGQKKVRKLEIKLKPPSNSNAAMSAFFLPCMLARHPQKYAPKSIPVREKYFPNVYNTLYARARPRPTRLYSNGGMIDYYLSVPPR